MIGMRRALVALAFPAAALVAVALAPQASADRRPLDSHRHYFPVEPGVYATRVGCTTEPAPVAPIVKVRTSPKGRLRLRVTGPGAWCQARWTGARAAPGSTDVTLTPGSPPDVASLCGTCTVDLLVTRLGRGNYRVTVGATTIRAHAP